MTSLDAHYQALELTSDATHQEIKASYRRLIKCWHPDQFPEESIQRQQAEEKVKAINIAYNALKSVLSGGQPAPAQSSTSPQSATSPQFQRRTIEASALYQDACDFARVGDYQAAAASLSLAIKLNPTSVEAYRYRGLIYSQLGYERRAEADLQKAKQLENDSTSNQTAPPSPNANTHKAASKPDQPEDLIPTTQGWTSQRLIAHQQAVTGLAVYRSTLVSCGRDAQVHLWNLKTQKKFCTLSEGRSPLRCMALSRDGQLLATGDEAGMIRLWHLPTSTLLRSLTSNDGAAVRSLIINLKHGIVIAATAREVIAVWDLRKGQLIQVLTGSIVAINSMQYWAPQSKLIAGCGDGGLRTWDLSQKYSFKRFPIDQSSIHTTLLSQDGRRLIFSGADGLIRTWSTLTEELGPTIVSQQGALNTLAMSADSSSLVSGGENGSVRVWNMQDGTLEAHLSGHQGAALSSIIADGQVIVGGFDPAIYLWSKT